MRGATLSLGSAVQEGERKAHVRLLPAWGRGIGGLQMAGVREILGSFGRAETSGRRAARQEWDRFGDWATG